MQRQGPSAHFPRTLVWRHRKENLKKCSLRGLETREDFYFVTYPEKLPDLKGYVLLDLEGEPLGSADSHRGILIIDGTWRYASVMLKQIDVNNEFVRRAIPSHYRTAYPRYQTDCLDPERGLASLEAVYISYLILGRDTTGLLDRYYWKDHFLNINGFT
jgi:pre-rRNA-processing protein TSR3